MHTDIKAFYDRFVEDFSTFDGNIIADRYLAPYTAVTRDGAAWLCSDAAELVDYFQSLLNKHSQDGVTHCKYEDLEYASIGNRCYMATVTWTMMDKNGGEISNWRESYNLLETPNGLKIFTSIDH